MAPNVVLRRLLAETGWTQAWLAREVNAAGAETGLALRYDRSAVSHWLGGRRPWGPVPGLLAETLSRALGRTVTVAELGLDGRGEVSGGGDRVGGAVAAGAAAGALGSAAGALGSAAGALGSATGAYSLAALAVPGWATAVVRFGAGGAELSVGTGGADRAGGGGSGSSVGVGADHAGGVGALAVRLTAGQVSAAQEMVGIFEESDTSFGGGRGRAALGGYLAHDIAPLLAMAGRPALRARMFSVATELSYLCAFMCFDDERHALAQRYYLTALDLATENGDAAGYAIAQRALSVQAGVLGHHREALNLAEDAARTARDVLPPARRAFFEGQLAVAAAGNDDRRRALAALRAAERLLSGADSAHSAMGGYHLAALYHQRGQACALLGDRAESVAALTESLRHRPARERRSRAVVTARLAEHQLGSGHLEEAVATWHAFLDDYPLLRSGRVSSALRGMRSRLRPYAPNAAVGRLLARAAAVASVDHRAGR